MEESGREERRKERRGEKGREGKRKGREIYEFNSQNAECSNRKKRYYNDIKSELHILYKNTKTL